MADKERVLVVDDDEVIGELLSRRLAMEGYECEVAGDGTAALSRIQDDAFQVMLTDIRMPEMDGIELLTAAKDIDPDLEIIMVTGVAEATEAIKAMKLGAYDYVMKPFDLENVILNVQRALERRRLHVQSKVYQRDLECKVEDATRELLQKNRQIRLLLLNTITSFAHVLEAKDTYTEGHSRRVAESAVRMATSLSLSSQEVENMRLAGLLHDIGKVGIREKTLNKPGKLTSKEYDEVKTHPLISERILQPIEELRIVVKDIKHHHERYDGLGYPSGLQGTDIPFGARILALADAYDAMTSERPYRPAFTPDQALAEIKANAGTQFDPQLALHFLSIHSSYPSAARGRLDRGRSATTCSPAVLPSG